VVTETLRSVRAALAEWPVTTRWLVGVSGGRDSVVLLHILSALGYQHLLVCHLDHSLRGPASTEDARWVTACAAEWGFETWTECADVARHAAIEKLSIETAARHLRFAFFARMAQQHQCPHLLLAHHADDQAETVFMNVCRGAGLAGLAGMSPVTHHGPLIVVRPLLNLSRHILADYATAHQLTWREDSSNADPTYLRNRVRHQVLPFLTEQLGRTPQPALLRLAQIAAEEDHFLTQLTETALVTCRAPAPDQMHLILCTLRSLDPALQRRVLLAWLRENDIPEISFTLVDAIRALVSPGAPTARVNLPGTAWVRRRAGRLFIQRI
jgi:tRNA(Ile)-lysidine synthase